jgi:glycosyltransferase involved in cell wall biosynthesis
MRITFISPTVDMSGGMRVIAIYAQHLARMGHVVHIVSPPPVIPPLRHKLKSLLKGTGWPDNSAPKSHFDGSELSHHVLDRWRPVVDGDVPDGDVVIATWWETAEWVNVLRPSKGAKVYFIQGHEVFPYLPVARCRATYRLPLHKIVIARWLKRVMSLQYGDDAVDLVPNSVDRSQFFAPVRGKQPIPTIGLLYSTNPLKGLDASLAAIRSARQQITDLRVIAFGNQQLASDLGIPGEIEFFHSPPQNEIRNLYARCDVWITSSRSEGFNLPAIEAMACRTPVVATRTGWPEEAIKSNWNGVLTDIDDVAGLAQGVEWVLSRNNEEWMMLSSNAYETAASGSWEESAELFERALMNACRRSALGEIAGQSGPGYMPGRLGACGFE